MADERDPTQAPDRETETSQLAEQFEKQKEAAQQRYEAEDISNEELNTLSPPKSWEIEQAAKAYEERGEALSQEAESSRLAEQFEEQKEAAQQGYETEDISNEELNTLSPPKSWEIEQAAKAYEEQGEALSQEAESSRLAEQFEEQAANPEHTSMLAEAHTEMIENTSATSDQATVTAQSQDAPGPQSTNEYEPTPEDWAEYGEYLAEEGAQKQAQYEESPHIFAAEEAERYAEYSNEMEAVFDRYAEQGDDEPSREQEREEPER